MCGGFCSVNKRKKRHRTNIFSRTKGIKDVFNVVMTRHDVSAKKKIPYSKVIIRWRNILQNEKKKVQLTQLVKNVDSNIMVVVKKSLCYSTLTLLHFYLYRESVENSQCVYRNRRKKRRRIRMDVERDKSQQ